jgi:hypothetical protein
MFFDTITISGVFEEPVLCTKCTDFYSALKRCKPYDMVTLTFTGKFGHKLVLEPVQVGDVNLSFQSAMSIREYFLIAMLQPPAMAFLIAKCDLYPTTRYEPRDLQFFVPTNWDPNRLPDGYLDTAITYKGSRAYRLKNPDDMAALTKLLISLSEIDPNEFHYITKVKNVVKVVPNLLEYSIKGAKNIETIDDPFPKYYYNAYWYYACTFLFYNMMQPMVIQMDGRILPYANLQMKNYLKIYMMDYKNAPISILM